MPNMVVEHSNNKHLYFEEFGYVQSGSYYGKARPGYRLHFVLNGSGYFNGIEVSAKNYFLSFPNSPDYYGTDFKNVWEYFWISFSGSAADEILEQTGINSVTGPILNFDRVCHFFQNVILKDFQPMTSQSYAQGCFSILMSYMAPDPAQQSGGITAQHIKKAKCYINSYYDRKITIADIAEFVLVDERYLYNIFKKSTGISLKEYLNRKRFHTACVFLENSKMPINEIASSVGFSDPLYFSNFFKERSGLSPVHYRKLKKQDKQNNQTE